MKYKFGFRLVKVAGVVCSAVLIGSNTAYAIEVTTGTDGRGINAGSRLVEESDLTPLSNAASTADSKAVVADAKAVNADAKATRASIAASTADSKAVVADAKAVSAGRAASVADSKAVVADAKAVTADNKAVSAGRAASVADSKAVVADAKAVTADNKAVSAGRAASVADSKAVVADAKAVSAGRAASVADSKAVVADAKAVTADNKAVSAGRAASVADAKAVVADAKAVTADNKAVSAGRAASVADSKAVVADAKAVTADNKAVSAGRAASVADSKAVVADAKAVTADNKAVSAGRAASVADSKAVVADAKAEEAQDRVGLIESDTSNGEVAVRRAQIGSGGLSVSAGDTSLTSADGTSLKINNQGISGNSADGSAKLTVRNGEISQLVTNSDGNTHGLVIGQERTTLSGGSNSTYMTLDDNGVRFGKMSNNRPVKVTGVADGKEDYDAVNFRQLDKVNKGVAMGMAMDAIPQDFARNHNYALGVGAGRFNDQNAVALGMFYRDTDWNLTYSLKVAHASGNKRVEQSASLGIGWSF